MNINEFPRFIIEPEPGGLMDFDHVVFGEMDEDEFFKRGEVAYIICILSGEGGSLLISGRKMLFSR
jgi:hypothetical protein